MSEKFLKLDGCVDLKLLHLAEEKTKRDKENCK